MTKPRQSRKQSAIECAKMARVRLDRAIQLMESPERWVEKPRQEAASRLLGAIASTELALRYHLGLEGL